MVEIYVDQISERLIYVLDFVFLERGLTYKLNNDYFTFIQSAHFKLNYSERELPEILQIRPSTMLFDEGLFTYAIDKGIFHEEICLSFNRILDPLASIFYILSRMEEYGATSLDEHNRFLAKNCILYKNGWLDKAICDRWAIDFLHYLSFKLGLEVNYESNFVPIRPTFDIDNTYAYQYKSGLRKYLSIAKDYIHRDKERLAERKQVLSGAAFDPYDTFDFIESIVDKGFKINMFWLLGDYAKYDKNISYKIEAHQQLIKRFVHKAIVGIHPSYKSNDFPSIYADEILRLESIIGEEVKHNRQHFLRLSIPQTYHNLIKQGVEHDYTMGFADAVGFRMGTARPTRWFDLKTNQITSLIIHPFVYMDGTLNDYLKVSPSESMLIISNLHGEVSKFGGEFMFIWHNETIGNYRRWFGWREVLEFTLSLK